MFYPFMPCFPPPMSFGCNKDVSLKDLLCYERYCKDESSFISLIENFMLSKLDCSSDIVMFEILDPRYLDDEEHMKMECEGIPYVFYNIVLRFHKHMFLDFMEHIGEDADRYPFERYLSLIIEHKTILDRDYAIKLNNKINLLNAILKNVFTYKVKLNDDMCEIYEQLVEQFIDRKLSDDRYLFIYSPFDEKKTVELAGLKIINVIKTDKELFDESDYTRKLVRFVRECYNKDLISPNEVPKTKYITPDVAIALDFFKDSKAVSQKATKNKTAEQFYLDIEKCRDRYGDYKVGDIHHDILKRNINVFKDTRMLNNLKPEVIIREFDLLSKECPDRLTDYLHTGVEVQDFEEVLTKPVNEKPFYVYIRDVSRSTDTSLLKTETIISILDDVHRRNDPFHLFKFLSYLKMNDDILKTIANHPVWKDVSFIKSFLEVDTYYIHVSKSIDKLIDLIYDKVLTVITKIEGDIEIQNDIFLTHCDEDKMPIYAKIADNDTITQKLTIRGLYKIKNKFEYNSNYKKNSLYKKIKDEIRKRTKDEDKQPKEVKSETIEEFPDIKSNAFRLKKICNRFITYRLFNTGPQITLVIEDNHFSEVHTGEVKHNNQTWRIRINYRLYTRIIPHKRLIIIGSPSTYCNITYPDEVTAIEFIDILQSIFNKISRSL